MPGPKTKSGSVLGTAVGVGTGVGVLVGVGTGVNVGVGAEVDKGADETVAFVTGVGPGTPVAMAIGGAETDSPPQEMANRPKININGITHVRRVGLPIINLAKISAQAAGEPIFREIVI